ncbi:hypothetical protein CK203_079970 [Vitis vinifera]|uniref:Retrovirus-related Pol polyprotein from transposon TNT 1-94 n=1 Tax=Vitis vinifera TaxID=29760 RepID=A0A438E580_VITVI|nr:hypothetical protein CK203_079970 [Vitis vinifera]
MGDSRSTLVISKGKVLLKLTFRKLLALIDVLHVPDIHWNLVLVSLLGKTRVKILFDSDKIVLTKNDAFLGKGYSNQGLFMLNVYDIINNNASSSSAYTVDSCDIWHDHEIIHETTPPYSLESNGVGERKNGMLKDMMNAMLVSLGAPLNLLGEAILSACHIQSRIPYKKTDKTPYELWKGYAPNISYLKVWGCLAKVLLSEPKK